MGIAVFIALVALVALALVAPPFVVGLAAVGVPPVFGLIAFVALVLVARWRWRARLRGLAHMIGEAFAWTGWRRRVLAGLWLIVGIAAAVQGGRVGRFMLDVRHSECSALPGREFFRHHSCLTAYTEAARLVPTGVNVYDPALYRAPTAADPDQARFIGPLEVDVFEYPPQFLLLPRAAAGADLFAIRRGWFGLQALSMLAIGLLLAAWIGGPAGLAVGLLLPALWLAPPTLLTIQIGNFHITAVALGILAMMAFSRRRFEVGGTALAFAAVSKVFPGIIGVLLLFQRRWRAISWIVGAVVVLTAAALGAVGPKPFVDFVRYQLPRLHSGDAVPWIEMPEMSLGNFSVYGLVTKLRLLGVPWTGKAQAQSISSVYPVLVLVLAYFGARRLTQVQAAGLPQSSVRLRTAQIWLALLTMASLRSDFVPGVYGTIGTLWLLTLLAAERPRAWACVGLALTACLVCVNIDRDTLANPIPLSIVGLTLLSQMVLLALNVWVLLRPVRFVPAGPA